MLTGIQGPDEGSATVNREARPMCPTCARRPHNHLAHLRNKRSIITVLQKPVLLAMMGPRRLPLMSTARYLLTTLHHERLVRASN
jgi:hypothetical protein